MVVLNYEQYEEILQFVRNFRGLSIDCNREIVHRFPQHNPRTLGSILTGEARQQLKQSHAKITARADDLLAEYNKKVKSTGSLDVLVKMAISLRIPPVSLCRIILCERFPDKTKSNISKMVRNPDLIKDSLLAANVSYCLFNEIMEGPITDTFRRCIGEEYEAKLAQMARDAGLAFHDENYLRTNGYDKTPDLKLAVPCLYKGKIVNWIESKASFGDMDSHLAYLRDQLISYKNR